MLLRGINVGGRNAVPMGGLRELCGELAHEDVVTYVQSGNVVVRTKHPAKVVVPELERAIEKRFGLDVTVVLRTHGELEKIADASPFDTEVPKQLHVVFLDGRPNAAAVRTLDPNRSPGDTFQVSGSEIYIHYPNGSGRTKLTLDYFESKLGVRGTARNWNTLLKLVELTAP